MISTLIAFALMAGGNELVCPIMGEAANMAGPKVEYNGAMFAFCCGGCDSTFSKDPVAAFKNPKTKGKAIGMYLFDPVSRRRIESKEAKAFSTYEGIVFPFESAANKATFDKDAKKFGTMPKKDLLICPVTGEKIDTYASAASFYDVAGTRYYTCCAGCIGSLEKNSAKYAGNYAKQAAAPKAVKAKAN